MKTTLTIAKREFAHYFLSPIAYVFITVFLSLNYWLFFSDFFVQAQATLRQFFTWTPVLFLIFIPAITMNLWAEEKKMGTLEILLTLPVRDWEVTLGKFFGALFFLGVTLITTTPLVATVWALGELDLGPVIGGYMGLVFLGMLCIAVGLYFSSLTSNAIIAFILSFLVLFIFYIIGEPFVLNQLPAGLGPFLASVSLGTHFKSISRGLIDSRDILYYLTASGFFLYLSVMSLESRKWEK